MLGRWAAFQAGVSWITGWEACVTLFMKPLDKDAEITKSRRNLPHWEQAGCTYFITWRLADSIPAEKVRGWMAERDR